MSKTTVSTHVHSIGGVADISADVKTCEIPVLEVRESGALFNLFIWDCHAAAALLTAAEAINGWYEDRADREGGPDARNGV